MADVKTLRTEEEIELINRIYGESYLETASFELARKAARIQAQRKENVSLLKAFSDFCEERGILWFVYGGTLRGVVAYGDFLPGIESIELGMPRDDYQRFEQAYRALEDEGQDALPWIFQPYFDNTHTRRIFAHLNARFAHPVMSGEKMVYGPDSHPLVARGAIQVTVFDEVPDDFYTRKKFYRQIKRRNTFFKRTITKKLGKSAREIGGTWVSENTPNAYSLVPLKCASWGMHSLAQRYQGRDTKMVARVTGWRSVTLPKTDIGQTEWRPFAGIEVRCPVRPDIWAKEPIYETTPELKRLQDDAKIIVCEIDRICKELGIRYFACGGTMLGHVRHGGFIPWDDDIDVGMLRADYETFKAKAGDLIDASRFFLQTRETDPTIPYLFSKVRMVGTEYITEYNKFRPFNKGICVDVFPFDYIPNGVSEQSAFHNEVAAASKHHNHIANRQYTKEQAAELAPDRRDLDYCIGQAIGRIVAFYYRSFPLSRTQQTYDKTATRYNDMATELGLEYVASFVPSYTMVRVDDLFPTQRVKFDDIEVEIPKNPEVFLDMQYGDYMVMPYLHQRVGHDLLLWADAQGVGGGREGEGAEDANTQWG